jgi:hypothetical protein
VFTARYEQMSGFNLGSVHLTFVLEKVALGQGFLRVLRFSPVSLAASILYTVLRSSKCFCYQKDKRAKPENLLKKQYSFRNREASDRKEPLCLGKVTAFGGSSLCTISQTPTFPLAMKTGKPVIVAIGSLQIAGYSRNWQPTNSQLLRSNGSFVTDHKTSRL